MVCMTALTELDALTRQLADLRAGALTVSTFSTAARGQTRLIQALPPRYGEVLLNLLDRLEAGALFSEESCSFSQRDLLDSLTLWTDKARVQLDTHP